jgi:C_GCAxxG_C_C family probable redox protein
MPNRREFIRHAGALAISLPVFSPIPRGEGARSAGNQEVVDFEQSASEYLGIYGNCAQASFAALQEHFDLDGGEIVRALSPFPGVGLQGDTCGAVTGSLMALGLLFGRGEGEEYSKFLDVAAMAREFCARFRETLGSTKCGDIHETHLGRRFDLSDPAEFDAFHGAAGNLCVRVVATGVGIAAEMIESRRTLG